MAANTDSVSDTGSLSDGENNGPRRHLNFTGNYAGAARTGLFTGNTERNHGFHTQVQDNRMPDRPCTATITPRGRFLASDIFDTLRAAEIDPKNLGCLQRKTSGEVILTFHKAQHKELFLTKCALNVNLQLVAIQDVDHPLTYLNIYNAPHELPDSAIIHRLATFCEVVHHRRGKFREPEEVFNSVRHYRVKIRQPIPSYLRFGRIQVVLKHQGQEETCRHCNLPGHYAHSCNQEICYNCDNPGHQARSCPQPILCSICHSDSHRAKACPHSWCPTVRVTKSGTWQKEHKCFFLQTRGDSEI